MPSPLDAAVIGGGPAGLMAAEALAAAGIAVDLFDAMPSVGRKLLLAGKGGLNLTHSESFDAFLARYRDAAGVLEPSLRAFGPQQVRSWAQGLGVDTFVGSSGRVFPTDFKAAPLLRAWLRRLKAAGVRLHARHRWQGWDESGRLVFAAPAGPLAVAARRTVLALGGASWPQLGSDGRWMGILAAAGIATAPLRPANCGFDAGWSEGFAARFAGCPVKPVAVSFAGQTVRGELMPTATGVEGGAVYALSAALRDAIAADGAAVLRVDLKPDWTLDRVAQALAAPRGSRSLSTHLARTLRLEGAAAALLREGKVGVDAAAVKALPLRLTAPRPLAEAISTAGGIRFAAVDDGLMLATKPGVFVCGEMLDWEAPTGGYLLNACLASGLSAVAEEARWR
ncbi:MAG: TIGR03862 family flavoprotein [Magnetospirillum sp.]|nr:TIGR03862 family flavoprotein [Magnetospirillum sp.]